MNNVITIKNLSKNYQTLDGEIEAIENISLNISEGEIVGIVGSSGCGKSTFLSILANLEEKTSGEIINHTTNYSYMLQNDALLPWLSVLDNACLGLDLKKIKIKENINYAKNLLIRFGLENFMHTKPDNLSGGMRQRVALVRTLATNPKVILLDEPLSAIDYVTRLMISDDIYQIIKEKKITTILISHDIAECVSFCDKVVILSKRPAIIKNMYQINLQEKKLPSQNRKDILFNYYYDNIWGDLDKDIL